MKTLFLIISLLFAQTAFSAEITNESEAGIAVAAGNSDSQNYNVKQSNSYKFDANTIKFDARFLNAFANDVESARYLFAALRYDRELNDRFSLFISQGFESDKFAGYYLKEMTDGGLKYNIIKTETFYWLAEVGYRYTNEKENDGTHDYKNSVRAYTETEKKWNENVSTKYYAEYIPNLKDGDDYEFNTELSLSAALSKVFSIKTAYLLRYDHLPPGPTAGTTDTLLTTALVAKF